MNTPTMKPTFGARIFAWRQRQGLTQAQAAARLQVGSWRTIQNWELNVNQPTPAAQATYVRIMRGVK